MQFFDFKLEEWFQRSILEYKKPRPANRAERGERWERSEEETDQISRGAGGQCDHDQRHVHIRKRNGDRRADKGRDRASRRVENGGNGHGAQDRVGNVIQKAAEKARADLFAKERQRQHANQIRHAGHDENIKEQLIVELYSK